MSDSISRQEAINAIPQTSVDLFENCRNCELLDRAQVVKILESLPSAEPTLRERALMLLLNWAVECGFGYDNFPEEYERYKDEIEDMSYFDGMIYIAEKEARR